MKGAVWGIAYAVLVVLLVLAFVAADRRPAAPVDAEARVDGILFLAFRRRCALGGVFNSLVAPALFPTVAEYPIAIVLACVAAATYVKQRRRFDRADVALPLLLGAVLAVNLVAIRANEAEAATKVAFGAAAIVAFSFVRSRVRFAPAVCALFLAGNLVRTADGRVLDVERNFFGVKVVSLPAGRPFQYFIDSTIHGIVSTLPGRERDPLAYYADEGRLLRLWF